MILEIYATAAPVAREAIEQGKFDVVTPDDERILPSVWESVVEKLPFRIQGRSIFTVRLSPWADSGLPDARGDPESLRMHPPRETEFRRPPEPIMQLRSRPFNDEEDFGMSSSSIFPFLLTSKQIFTDPYKEGEPI